MQLIEATFIFAAFAIQIPCTRQVQAGSGIAGRLNFEIDTELEPGLISARAGVPSLIEAFRLTGAAAVVVRTVKLKQRKRGLSSSEVTTARTSSTSPS